MLVSSTALTGSDTDSDFSDLSILVVTVLLAGFTDSCVETSLLFSLL